MYLPHLNRNLAEFVSADNNHKISTEESNTPAQLFCANLHLTAFGEGCDSQNAFRHVNISDLIFTELPHVHVPETTNPLDHSSYRELQGLVDPLFGTNGKELYLRTVDFFSEECFCETQQLHKREQKSRRDDDFSFE